MFPLLWCNGKVNLHDKIGSHCDMLLDCQLTIAMRPFCLYDKLIIFCIVCSNIIKTYVLTDLT